MCETWVCLFVRRKKLECKSSFRTDSQNYLLCDFNNAFLCSLQNIHNVIMQNVESQNGSQTAPKALKIPIKSKVL